MNRNHSGDVITGSLVARYPPAATNSPFAVIEYGRTAHVLRFARKGALFDPCLRRHAEDDS